METAGAQINSEHPEDRLLILEVQSYGLRYVRQNAGNTGELDDAGNT